METEKIMQSWGVGGKVGVKICGITRAEDWVLCGKLGVDAIGLNFWEHSKRYISVERVRILTKVVEDFFVEEGLVKKPLRVAVFVNPKIDLLEEIISEKLADVIQLHGEETPEFCEMIMKKFHTPVIKAIGMQGEGDVSLLDDFPTSFFLLDSFNPEEFGGSGKAFSWWLARKAKEQFPEKKIFLSGGLNAENVRQAIFEGAPDAVDVASGVELAPGWKEEEKVIGFVKNSLNKSADYCN